MTEVILRHPKFYALQNGIAALLFATILLAEVSAHLLHQFPGVELFWRIASLSNQTVGPFLTRVGDLVGHPIALLFLLGSAVLIPIVSWKHRSWLGTAMSGHVALIAFVFTTWMAMKRANTGRAMANISDIFDPRLLNTGSTSLILLTATMAVLCVSNHVAFFSLNGNHNGRRQ